MIFVLIFLAGFLTLTAISSDFKIRERVSFAFPIGFGFTALIMILEDRLLGKITLGLTEILLFLGCLKGIAWTYYFTKFRNRNFENPFKTKIDFSGINLVWLVFMGMSAYLVWGIIQKCMYWPPAEFDTIAGYDLLAKGIANEGKILNSLLLNKEVVNGCGPRLLYPPLVALCNSLCYFSGMETPKLINALFYISWVFSFYFLLRRFISSTGASVFTFLVIIVPEMFAHASFSLTNLPCGIYTTFAVVGLTVWHLEKKEGFFWFSFMSMMMSIFTRSEPVVFIGASCLALFIAAWKDKKFKHFVIYCFTILPYLIWSFMLQAVPRNRTNGFVNHLFFDFDKLEKVFSTAWSIMNSNNIYGITFYIFLFALFLNLILTLIKDRKNILQFDQRFFLFISLLSWFGYTLIFYQVDETDGSLWGSGGWLQSGYKRGLFSFAPLAIFYAGIGIYVKFGFEKLHNLLTFIKKPA